jgi:hypothetical protein
MAIRRHAAALVLAPVAALAAPAPAVAQEPADQAMAVLGLGAAGLRANDPARVETELQLRGVPLWWRIEPQGGLMVTAAGSIFGWAGIAVDLPLGDSLTLTPAFGPGFYNRGDGKDLGNTLEFRTQVELAWRFDDGMRVGAQAYHISNAGLGTRNPGIEGALLVVGLPIGP